MAGGFDLPVADTGVGATADTTVPVVYSTIQPSAAVHALRFVVHVTTIQGTWSVFVRQKKVNQTLTLASVAGLSGTGLFALTPAAPFDGNAAVPTNDLEVFFDNTAGPGNLLNAAVRMVGAEG